jgi:hypothetical protein
MGRRHTPPLPISEKHGQTVRRHDAQRPIFAGAKCCIGNRHRLGECWFDRIRIENLRAVNLLHP